MKPTTQLNLRWGGRARGFGLVELMIAVVIGLILIAGVTEIFLSSKRTYATTNELSRLQENARYAAHMLTQDLRMAGFSGCSPKVRNMLNPAGTGYSKTLWDVNQAVGGWEYDGTGYNDTYTITTLAPAGVATSKWDNGEASSSGLPTDLQDRVVPGTDVIAIKRLTANSDIKLKDNNNAKSSSLNTEGANGIAQYTILMVTKDCMEADLFQKRNNASATSISAGNGSSSNPGPGNSENKFSAEYDSETQVLFFETAVYYIGSNPSGQPALYRVPFAGKTLSADDHQELAAGVESLQVVFGEDTDATPDGVANRYVSIDEVTDGAKIVDVRFSLLMRTEGEPADAIDSTSTYTVAGKTTINPQDDRRLRYVLTSTVKLRNRGI